MNIKKILSMGSLAVSMFFVACEKDDADDENTTAQDQSFMTQAAISNRSEIELGTLAATMATDTAVRQFAQMMVTDHTAAQNELEEIADDVDFNFSSLDTAGAAMKQLLSGLSGRAFDSAYIHSQVAAHQQAETIFQTQVSNGTNQQLRTYATQTLPKIQMHLNTADSLSNFY